MLRKLSFLLFCYTSLHYPYNKTPKGTLELKKIDFLFTDSLFIYELATENDYASASA